MGLCVVGGGRFESFIWVKNKLGYNAMYLFIDS